MTNGWKHRHVSHADYHLRVNTYDAGHARWALALHGFTGDGLDYAPIAEQLGVNLIAPDLIGHGGSAAPAALTPYSMSACVEALSCVLDTSSHEAVDLIGYSMGGRAALSLLCVRPDLFGRVVLIGASPGLAQERARIARRHQDDALADRIEELGVEAFLNAWSQKPIIKTQERIAASWRAQMRERRLSAKPRGFANSLRGMGTGQMPPLWDKLDAIHNEVLLLTGEEDAKFNAIAESMRALLPASHHTVIEGAGHCAHLERPKAAVAAIRGFLAR